MIYIYMLMYAYIYRHTNCLALRRRIALAATKKHELFHLLFYFYLFIIDF